MPLFVCDAKIAGNWVSQDFNFRFLLALMADAKDILAIAAYTLGTCYYLLELTNHWPKGGLISRPRPLEKSRPLSLLNRLRSKFFISGYLINDEVLPILGIGLLINCGGVLLTRTFKNLLFLDMVGTAFSSFLLGPWYGALCGLISNSFVNYVMYPGDDADKVILPWSLVNMAGGLYWGFVARNRWFRNYISETHTTVRSHFLFVLIFGVLASIVVAIPGAFIQGAVGDAAVLQDSPVASTISILIQKFCSLAHLGQVVCRWLMQSLWSIPDKAISAALAVTVVRLGFPLYERELIHTRPNETRPRDGWFGPIALLLAYVPSLFIFMKVDTYKFDQLYLLWLAPLFVFVLRMIYLVFARSPQNLEDHFRARSGIYDNVLKVIQANVGHSFFKRLRIATILSTLLFTGGLLLLGIFQNSELLQISGHFLLVTCGMLLAIYAVQLALGQNALVSGSMATVSEIQKEAVTKTLGTVPAKKEDPPTVEEPQLSELKLTKRGKVRHLFDIDDQMLIVASDRIPVLDREIDTTVPGKGVILTKLSAFWFSSLKSASPHHFLTTDFSQAPYDHLVLPAEYKDRAMLVRKLDMINFEFIVRGYLAGSAWEEYSETGRVAGIELKRGLEKYARLDQLIFSPTTKADTGPELPISFEVLADDLGSTCATQLRTRSFALFKEASEWCEKRGLILCDTKFEFGWKPGAQGMEDLLLADEIFTPDSSRFFKATDLVRGHEAPSWDKDIVANYLRRVGWTPQVDKSPAIPSEIVSAIANRYEEIYRLITSPPADEIATGQR
jgi:phosphoribosylaminoimidazole-succinocarboxamide synthase